MDENGTLFFANFSKLLEKLHPENAEHLCTVFINLCFTYILFDNIEKNTYYELSKMSSVSSVIDYIKDNDIECETYMEKCDAVRGSHRTYPDTLEDAKNKAASRSSYSYPRSYSSSSSDCCGGCYVATCVYGSYDCPQVWTLRRFRDDTLGSTWYGRAFSNYITRLVLHL